MKKTIIFTTLAVTLSTIASCGYALDAKGLYVNNKQGNLDSWMLITNSKGGSLCTPTKLGVTAGVTAHGHDTPLGGIPAIMVAGFCPDNTTCNITLFYDKIDSSRSKDYCNTADYKADATLDNVNWETPSSYQPKVPITGASGAVYKFAMIDDNSKLSISITGGSQKK